MMKIIKNLSSKVLKKKILLQWSLNSTFKADLTTNNVFYFAFDIKFPIFLPINKSNARHLDLHLRC